MERWVQLFLWVASARIHAAKEPAVVFVVDPYWDDVASYPAHVPLLKNYKLITVITHQGSVFSYDNEGHAEMYRTFTYSAKSPNVTLASAEICPQLKGLDEVSIEAVMPTSDPSVALTDHLAHCLGLPGNPAFGPLAKARRNKWVMGEAVKKAGLRTMKEKLVYSWKEAHEYLTSLDKPLSKKNPVIFKIVNGAGGEGVVKVHSLHEARKVFDKETGGDSLCILIQEYLFGREYAVDSVSRDGVHKVVAVWFEDFRPANGIFDQYFGFKLLDPKDAFTKKIIDYANKVLVATGLRNGAANTEVKWLEDEKAVCLVEINARWAGVGWHDGLAVEKAAVGIDQYTAAVNSYLDPKAFDAMPAVMPLKQHGAVIFSVNYHAGVLRGAPGWDFAKTLPSYLDGTFDGGAAIGKYLPKTTPNADPCNIALVSKNKATIEADYDRLISIEYKRRFFDIQDKKHALQMLANDDGSLLMSPLLLCAVFSFVATAAIVLRRQQRKSEMEGVQGYISIE